MYVHRNDEWLPLDAESRSRLIQEAIREIARRSFSGAFIYFLTISGILFASNVWADEPKFTTLTLVVTFLGAVVRCVASSRLLRTDVKNGSVLALRASTIATVLAWGFYCGWSVYTFGHQWPASYLMIAGAALSGGAASSLAPDAVLGISSLSLLILPTAVCAALRGTPGSALLGISAFGYFVYLCAQLLSNCRTYWKTGAASAVDAMLSRRAAFESEIRFRTLFEDAPSGMYVAQRDGGIDMANVALAQMLGYDSPDSLSKRNLRELCAEADRAAISQSIENRGYASGCESDWMRRDGRLIRVRESARMVHAGGGVEARVLGSVEDVTARFEADETRRQLIEILESTSDFVESVSLTGKTLYLNSAARVLLGPGDESLWARGGDDDLRRARLGKAAVDGIWEGEAWLLAHDGKAVPVSQVIIAHRARDGAVQSFSIISRDISAIRAAEHALRETQEQLFQSQRLESLGRLAGGIAHDFNNLLTIVMGHASMLLKDIRQGHAQEGLVEIRRAAERAADLTGQLLAFGRRQVLSKGIVDVNETVGRAERMLRRVIGERIQLVTELSPAELIVSADAAQLEQMLVNLVLNGRDAMPDGGTATIETSAVYLSEPADPRLEFVCLRVSDTGIGMDEETRNRIFEPFFSTKGQGRGTGLGLATAYGFVNQSGGRISVSSSPGEGTTFEVLLPRSHKPANATPRAEFEPEIRGTERILIVDDEPALRGLLRQTLAGHGYRVLAAGNAEEALRIAASSPEPPDLLVTDVIMPGLTGPQLAVRMKAMLPDIGVVFISGYPGETEADRDAFGPDASYLAKPFTAESLLRTVRQRLQKTMAGRGHSSAHAG